MPQSSKLCVFAACLLHLCSPERHATVGPCPPAPWKAQAQRPRQRCNYEPAPPPPLQAPSRPVNQSWFSGRSLVITPQQSSAIVAALQQLGVLDANGWLRDDPRQGLKASRSISQAVQQQWAAA